MTQALHWSPFLYAHRVIMELNAQGALDSYSPIRIEAVAEAVKRVTSVSGIEFVPLDMRETSIKALTLIYESGSPSKRGKFARIGYSTELNVPWQRFAICKELCQVLLSESAASRTRQRDEVQLYLEGLLRPVPTVANEAVATEWLSSFCAMEVLCPLPLRAPLFDQVRAGEMTVHDVAVHFQAPLALVETIFMEPYHSVARQYLLSEPLPGWIFTTPSPAHYPPHNPHPSETPKSHLTSSYDAMRTKRQKRKRVSLSSAELLNQLYDERSS